MGLKEFLRYVSLQEKQGEKSINFFEERFVESYIIAVKDHILDNEKDSNNRKKFLL